MKRFEVARLLAIDSLFLEVKKGLDEGHIDMLTAYELTKFSGDEQLNLYHHFRLFRKIPQVVRVKALEKYMGNRGQRFNTLLIGEYRKYISNKYPIFNWLDGMRLGKLAENLEFIISEG